MAVAWSKDKVGKASGDVIVRDPVVLTATLPRFLRTGDRGAVQLELDNVEGAAGDYSIAVSSEGTVKLDGDKPLTLKLAAKQRDRVAVPVSAAGAGAEHGQGERQRAERLCARTRSYALDVRPATQILTRRTVRALAPGETLTLSNDLFADFVPGTGRVGAVGRDLDLARCRDAAERARPLSVRLLRADHQPRGGDALRQRARGAGASSRSTATSTSASRTPSQRLLARQDSNGSFGLWSVGGNDRLARRLRHRLPDARARARLRGAGGGVHAGARPAAQLRRRARPTRARTAAAISPMRSTCWRATAWRRSATCATSPTPSSTTSRRRSPRRRSPPRSPCSATRRAPTASISPRSTPSRRSPSSISAAPITARRCAMRRRW